jgi:heme O synthase-like polyprenyltransferase
VVAVALDAWRMRLPGTLRSNKALARKLYKYSLLYLTLVYLAYVADRLIT